jgi:two-component system, NtrC family, sensor histidine kinase PilS
VEVDRIDRTVRGLLNFSRPAEHTDILIDLNECCREALLLVQVYARTRGIQIMTSFADEPVIVSGDPRQLRQVFVNLLLNACEASAKEIHVATERLPDGDQRGFSQVQVRDTGTGMSAETVMHAFEPFFTTKTNGTGLGLSTCLQVVRGHGGSIELRSNEQGTTAILQFPLPVQESGNGNSARR